MLKIEKLFGNRLVVQRLDQPVGQLISPDDPAAATAPYAALDTGRRFGPAAVFSNPDEYGFGSYGKGRIVIIGEVIKPDKPDEWKEVIGESAADELDEGPGRFVKQVMVWMTEAFLASQCGDDRTPMPPLKIGDVVIYSLSQSRPLPPPEGQGLYTVDARGVIGVVSADDFPLFEKKDTQ